ncbi:MAG: terminase large subunit domain-containing protein [Candidatus Rokuibacteriota bacterium]
MTRPQATPPAIPSIVDVVTDRELFAPQFPAATWRTWFVILKALFALPMTAAEQATYRRHTGRQAMPTQPAREGWFVVGRRGGKSRMAALVAVYLACFRDYRPYLAPGERGTIMLIAADRRQARTVFRYITGLLDSVPMLASLIERRTRDTIHLRNRVTIEIHTASFRAVRGYTICAAVLDEVAFWPSEDSANPDTEVIQALRPAMATIPSALLLAISSPYARCGALWDAWRAHFGKDDDPVLVWQAEPWP